MVLAIVLIVIGLGSCWYLGCFGGSESSGGNTSTANSVDSKTKAGVKAAAKSELQKTGARSLVSDKTDSANSN